MAVTRLRQLDQRKGVKVLTRQDLVGLMNCNTHAQFVRLLSLLTENRVLERVARGVYLNCRARSGRAYLIEEIAAVLRRGRFNYVSLESILSEFGVISQIMISRLTIMTTGAPGVFETPYGTIEFTHTKRSIDCLRARTIFVERRPLPIATKLAGAADLRRVGRNIHMIDIEELNADD